MQTDSELVEAVREGDVQAFAVLMRRYERVALASTLGMLRDRHAAEDALQEAFVAAFVSLPSLRDGSKFGPWLLSIARKQAARAIRGIVVEKQHVADNARVGYSMANAGMSSDSTELLELVEKLPDNERVVIGLRYFEGLSAQEVATVTGRPVGTVTKQLSRAYKRLEGWLKKETPV